jgi:hypothetical protein
MGGLVLGGLVLHSSVYLPSLYIYFGFPLARLKWSFLFKSVRLPLHPRCALVADMDGARAVDMGGSESDACAGASSTGTAVNPLVVVMYLPLIARSVSNTSVSTN